MQYESTYNNPIVKAADEAGLTVRQWLYEQLNKHKTPAQVGREFNCSRQSVHYWITKFNVKRTSGEWYFDA